MNRSSPPKPAASKSSPVPVNWRSGPFGRTAHSGRYQVAEKSSAEEKEARTARTSGTSQSPSLSLVKALSGSPRDVFDGIGDGVSSGNSTPRSTRSTESDASTRASSNTAGRTCSSSSGGSGGSHSVRQGSRNLYVSFDDCSIDFEREKGAGSSGSTFEVLKDFHDVFGKCPNADGILQCIKLYGFDKPLKLQQHAIPAIINSFGGAGCEIAFNKGKSCVVIQGPPRIGKTSSLALALLAAVDTAIPHCQAIVLTTSTRRDFDKYFNIFTLMHPVTSQSFMADLAQEEDDQTSFNDEPEVSEWSEERSEVQAAMKAQILVGHPSKILRFLSSVSSMRLDFVRLLVIDDAEELVYSAQKSTEADEAQHGEMATEQATSASSCVSYSTAKGSDHASRTRSAMSGVTSASTDNSQKTHTTIIDDVVSICRVLECRQYSGQHMDTAHYRSDDPRVMVPQLRYAILSQQVTDQASRKIMRLLKNSLMKKKNLLTDCTLPTKVMRKLKHFYVEAPKTEWVRILAGLVHSLMFPRAIVFSDDRKPERLEAFLKEMERQNLTVSANVAVPSGNSSIASSQVRSTIDNRRQAVQDFQAGRTQLLFAVSEPAVCQIVLPKVSCVFHFDVPSDMLSVYGVRLLPLDSRHSMDAVSVLFAESASAKVKELEKMFSIQFMDMPFEFIPNSPPNSPPGSRSNSPSGGKHSPREGGQRRNRIGAAAKTSS